MERILPRVLAVQGRRCELFLSGAALTFGGARVTCWLLTRHAICRCRRARSRSAKRTRRTRRSARRAARTSGSAATRTRTGRRRSGGEGRAAAAAARAAAASLAALQPTAGLPTARQSPRVAPCACRNSCRAANTLSALCRAGGVAAAGAQACFSRGNAGMPHLQPFMQGDPGAAGSRHGSLAPAVPASSWSSPVCILPPANLGPSQDQQAMKGLRVLGWRTESMKQGKHSAAQAAARHSTEQHPSLLPATVPRLVPTMQWLCTGMPTQMTPASMQGNADSRPARLLLPCVPAGCGALRSPHPPQILRPHSTSRQVYGLPGLRRPEGPQKAHETQILTSSCQEQQHSCCMPSPHCLHRAVCSRALMYSQASMRQTPHSERSMPTVH